MKKFLIIFLVALSFTAKAQLVKYLTVPTETGYLRGKVLVDSSLRIPGDTLKSAANGSLAFKSPYLWVKDTVWKLAGGAPAFRDTTWTPSQLGVLAIRPQDSLLYYYRGNPNGAHWVSVGGSGLISWGGIHGSISAQSDLVAKFLSKQDTLPTGLVSEYWAANATKRSFQSDVFSAIGNATFDLPLTYSTGHFGITQADPSHAGFVGSSDFTKFLQAYNGKVTSIDVTGSTTKTLSITTQDGTIFTKSWTDLTGGGTGGGNVASINGDTTSAQTIVTGTTGTDFNINTTAGATHLNIPTIGVGASRGLLSFADWQKLNAGGDTTNIVATHWWVQQLASKIRPIYLDYGLSYINDSTMKVDTSVIAYKAWAVPQSRKLTINGTTFDLSQDRTWSISTSSGLTFQQSLVNVANVVNLLNDSASLVNNRAYASISGNRGWKSMQIIDTTGWANGKFPYVSGTQFALKNLVISDVNSLQTTLNGKVNYTDSTIKYVTPTQLSAYNNSGKVNYTDSLTKYVTPTQLANFNYVPYNSFGHITFGLPDNGSSLRVPGFVDIGGATGSIWYTNSLSHLQELPIASGFLKGGGSVPVYSSVNLASTDVAGILPKANGGTGTATPGLVQGTGITITGTWPNQTIAASGSSGMSNPMTTLGDIIYGGASGTPTRLAGNATTTKKFITQAGDGTNSAAPTWGTIGEGDVAGLSGDLALLAPLVSPSFSGIPTASTASFGTSTTQLATTAFVAHIADDPMRTTTTTSDATPFTVLSTSTASNTTIHVKARVMARRTGGTAGTAGDGAVWELEAAFKNIGGTISQIGSTTYTLTAKDQAGWNAAFFSGVTIGVQLTGAANNNITWEVTYSMHSY